MTAEETIIWGKIGGFNLDEPDAKFKFSDRLARENGWSVTYTRRVINEYKKFIFLCCISTDGVTPSDPIDQVWHLHLTYTRSYWIDLYQNTIVRQIHHHPTKGGVTEAKRFKSYYQFSNNLYKQHFDTNPPADIWHTSDQCFTDIHFQRINLGEYWLVRKPALMRHHLLYVLSLLAIGLFIQAAELTIIPVLALIVIVIVVAVYSNNYPFKNDDKGSDSGCTSGCGGNTWDDANHTASHSHYSDDSNGCNSGCSDSGCSGCSSSD